MLSRWHIIGFGGLLLSVVLGLSACTVGAPNPVEVMDRAATRLAGLTSFNYRMDLTLSGSLISSFSERISRAHLKLSGESTNLSPETAAFTLAGEITADAKEGPVRINGELISLPDYIYFRIKDLALPTLIPLSLTDNPGWYKIRQQVVSQETVRNQLGIASTPKAAITSKDLETVQDLLQTTPLWSLAEVLPDETVNGFRSHHYLVKLEPEALKQIAPQLSALSKQPQISEDELKAWTSQAAEIWIDKRSFNLVRIKADGIYMSEGLPTAFDFVLDVARHNQSVGIIAPSGPEELNSDKLLPGLPF